MSPAICRNKFWIFDPTELWCNTHILPLPGSTVESQLNSITRLVLIMTLILAVLDFRNLFSTLMFGGVILLIVIIIYFVERKMNAAKSEDFIERFTSPCTIVTPKNPVSYKGDLYGINGIVKENYEFRDENYLPKYMEKLPPPKPNLPFRGQDPSFYDVSYTNSCRFCNDERDLDYTMGSDNDSYTSINQKLANQGVSYMNQRTNIPPVIVPPCADQEWAVNNLYVRTCINSDNPTDNVQSGYYVKYKDNFIPPCVSIQEPHEIEHQQLETPVDIKYNIIEPVDKPTIIETFQKKRVIGPVSPTKENFEKERVKNKDKIKEKIMVGPNEGKVLTYPQYNPAQLQNYLPSNASSGKVQTSGILNEYNKNILTQTLQPGIYTRSDVIEPISSNIGISFTQQFGPRTTNDDSDGIMFERHDGRVYKEYPPEKAKGCTSPDDVYDPRQSSYGTSYRAYLDPRFGAPRFYYDDVDDIRRPKFVLRSKIDTLTPEQCNSFENVDKTFRDMTQYQRNDLSERAMEKINNINYMKRLAPKTRGAPYNFKC